ASESVAREARYAFLKQARKQSNSIAIITAHHQDDRLETLIINLIRGTGRLGISSIGETKEIKRPLLNISRAELKNYGVRHKLNWREDPSNNDQRYLRNYVRHNLLPKISEQDKQHLVKLMNHQADLNEQIDKLVPRLLNASDINRLSLKTLNSLPFGESSELIATWLRLNNLAAFNRSTIERINVAAKTKAKGARIDVYGRARVEIEDGCLALYDTER
ncbi:MAG: tRNA lysidine(34) synthetase TilS, partial [Candidatus Saccharimonadales bacterium]